MGRTREDGSIRPRGAETEGEDELSRLLSEPWPRRGHGQQKTTTTMDTTALSDTLGETSRSKVGKEDEELMPSDPGAASILCWLLAQVPQLVHNYRTKSVDGLALPFLVSWLLGDATNLLGCILTHQLAFQRNLAAYFCFVDLGLTLQYLFYARKASKSSSGRRASGYERIPSAVGGDGMTDSMALARETTAEGGPTIEERWRRHSKLVTSGAIRPVGSVPREYARSLSRAARAGSGIDPSVRRKTSVERRAMTEPAPKPSSTEEPLADSTESLSSQPSGSTTDDARMAASVASLPRGRALARSTPLVAPLSPTVPAVAGVDTPLRRAMSQAGIARHHQHPHRGITLSPTVGRPSLRNARRQTTMIFLGAFAFLAFQPSSLLETDPTSVERACDVSSVPAPRDYQRLIGRTFAWLCTILYLTSRLPQIWKNYRRRSVEGLSITLFVMAALGNTFYVGSILASPKLRDPKSGYLLESIPYLLGSGGTLTFDFTIFAQSFVYKSSPSGATTGPRRRRTSQSRRVHHPVDAAEEEEALVYTDEPESEDPIGTGKHQRSRTRSGGRRALRGSSMSLERARRASRNVSAELADLAEEASGTVTPRATSSSS